MGFICGWLGNAQEQGGVLIDAMVRAPQGLPGAMHASQSIGGAALAVRDWTDRAPYFAPDGLCAVIEGHPKWDNNELTHLAGKSGMSRALAEGFRRNGPQVLEKLGGSFALCVLNPREKYALLAVDRVGIRPLAFTLANNNLVFGTQIDSLIRHPSVEAETDPQGIFNYLYFHMLPSPGTIYRNIEKLQPAECLEFQNGKIDRRFYYRLEFSERDESERELAAQLRRELNKSVTECLSRQPTGSFLSGGLDSSTVTGVFQSLSLEPVDAFAIGFDADGFDEMEFARASARHFGVSLHEYYVTPDDVLNAIQLIASAYDEPFGNASAIPAYYCAKLARENGSAYLLAGDGGDEIFAGNERYGKQKIFDLYRYIPDIIKGALIEPTAFSFPPLRKLKSYIEQARVPMPERMETYNFLHRIALTDIFDADFLAQIDHDEPITILRSTYERASSEHLIKKMLFLDHKFTLADNDLRKVNRMCELVGVEVRYPLLQDNMMAFAASVPTNMLLKRFELRSFFRHALKDFLAKETLDKSKHGFGLPFGLWLNEHPPLMEFADNNLQQIKQRGILNSKFIGQITEAHRTGHATYFGVMIWILIMLEQWLASHSDGK